MIKDLNVKTWNYKSPRRKPGVHAVTAVLAMFFLLDPQSKNKHVRLQQTKNLCTAKENHRTWKANYQIGENICKPYTW